MKSSFKIATMVLVVGVLCVGVVAVAADFVWDATGTDTSWRTATNWDLDSSYPQNANDNATIDAAGNLCTFDPGSALTINNLTLAGASPTKRTLHIKDAGLTLANLDLNDYAEIDADRNLTATTGTTLSGTVWIDVASARTTDLEDVDVDGATTALVATTSGTLKANDVVIDADAGGALRTLKFRGGTWDIENELSLKSDHDGNIYDAKFWLDTGSVTPEYLRLNGSEDVSSRVEMDIDQNFTIGTDTEAIGGRYSISVASGKTMNTKKLTLDANDPEQENDDLYFSVTGEGGGASQGKLVTAE